MQTEDTNDDQTEVAREMIREDADTVRELKRLSTEATFEPKSIAAELVTEWFEFIDLSRKHGDNPNFVEFMILVAQRRNLTAYQAGKVDDCFQDALDNYHAERDQVEPGT